MNKIIPLMVEKGRGKIINVSSVSILGERYIAAYCASKGGLNSLTKTLTLEYADKGININAICPGAVDTEMMRDIDQQYPGVIDAIVSRTPSGRMASPDDIAFAALYLASEESNFVNGLSLFVDGSIMNNVW
jgi:NAD(P)-dependent dehydrogenase (short-subunit alcohol dehydrogenase family)